MIALGVMVAGFMAGPELQALPNPASRFFVTEVTGEAFVRLDGRILPLKPKVAYPADGTVIETQAGSTVTVVLSNGTGVTLSPVTQVEIKRLAQEPFRPNRTDFEREPSISDAQLSVTFGTITVATSRLSAGSKFLLLTPQTELRAQGGRLVVTVTDNSSSVWVLDGGCTVRAEGFATTDQKVMSGEMAVATRDTTEVAKPVTVKLEQIPAARLTVLDDQLAIPTFARKTVYFEVRESTSGIVSPAGTSPSPQPLSDAGGARPAEGSVKAFETIEGSREAPREIYAVPVVPIELPVKFTVSPAQLTGS